MARLDMHPPPEVTEEEATGAIKSIYAEIKETLRVPLVNLVFRALASYPDYLQIAWEQIQPNLRTVYFERQADAIRAHAVESVASMGAAPRPPEDAAKVLRVFHYVNPKLLLAVTAIRTATGGQLPALRTLSADEKRQIQSGVPESMPGVTLVDPETEDERIRVIFDDIRSTLRVSRINSDYRALAVWPDYFAWAWQSVKPLVQRPDYHRLERELRGMAEEAVLSLPFRVELSPHSLRLCGLSEQDIDGVRTTLDEFYRLLPGLVTNIAFLSVGAEGEIGALRSPFPPGQA